MNILLLEMVDKLVESYQTSRLNGYPEYNKLFYALNLIQQINPSLNYEKHKPILVKCVKLREIYFRNALKKFPKAEKGWQEKTKQYFHKINLQNQREFELTVQNIEEVILFPYYESEVGKATGMQMQFEIPIPLHLILGEIVDG